MRWLDFRLRLSLLLLALGLGTFLTARLFLLFIYRDIFSPLNFRQFLMAFVDGLRFDLCTFATFLGMPLFMINLPILRKSWYRFWSLLLLIELFIIACILTIDIVFFGYVKRHIGAEAVLIMNDIDYLLTHIYEQYLLHLIILIIFLIFLLLWIYRFINKYYSTQKIRFSAELIRLFLLIAFLVFSIRGTFRFHGKPINVIDAFKYGKTEYGNLVLNGVFTAYHTLRSTKYINHNFYDETEAIKLSQQYIVEKDEIIINENYPLMRMKKKFFITTSRYNIVFFLLESWSAKFIDSFSQSHYGVTPNFDKIAKNGLMFLNFYANGQRSIEGIAAILVGIPTLPGLPYLGKGLEIVDITRLGKILKDYGYSTIFVQTSKRRSFRMEGIAAALGFEEFYGKEDIPMRQRYMTDKEPAFGYDYEGLMFLKERLDEIKEPFFAFFFSGTTHPPYILLDKKFEKYPHAPESLEGFLNTLYYADWSIGEFMKAAKKTDWFENTVFIFTADHTLGRFQGNDLRDRFWIPLVIYSPKLFSHRKINYLGSQADLIPTIIELLNIKAPYTAVGKSLFGDYKKRFVFFVEGNNIGLMTKDGYLKHNYKQRLETKAFNKNFDVKEAENTLLSIDEALYILLKQNRWYNSYFN